MTDHVVWLWVTAFSMLFWIAFLNLMIEVLS